MIPFRIRYGGSVKKITLFRNLLAKLCYSRVSIEEILVIYDLYEQMVVESEAKEEFDRKYGAWLITCYGLLNQINPQSYPYQLPDELKEIWVTELVPLLPSEKAFKSWKGNPVNRDSFRVTLDLQLKVRKPSGYKIGKGYTDKGTARNPAVDASPSWQHLAQSHIPDRGASDYLSKVKHDSHVIQRDKVERRTRLAEIIARHRAE